MSRFSSTVRCDAHPNDPLIEDYRAGDMICSVCGLVVADRVIDVSSEWRTFASDSDAKDNSRVGAAENPQMDGHGLTTSIGAASGSAGFGDDGRPLYRNRNSESTHDKAIRIANRDLNEMSERLSVDKRIVSDAQHCFIKIYTEKLIKGRSNDAIIAACMYIACRKAQVPRTFKEICSVSKSSKRDISRCYQTIMKTFNEQPNSTPADNVRTISSSDFFARFCDRLGLDMKIRKLATQLAEKANALNIVAGRSPVSLAAAAIYMAVQINGLKTTMKEIAEVSGVAENTIKQTYKVMQPKTKDLMPSESESTSSKTEKA